MANFHFEKFQIQVTAMAPSDDGEALFHINDIRFGYSGKNLLCVSCFSADKCATETSIDSTGYRSNMKKAFDTSFIKSENITAFMTVKHLFVNSPFQ